MKIMYKREGGRFKSRLLDEHGDVIWESMSCSDASVVVEDAIEEKKRREWDFDWTEIDESDDEI